MSRCALAAAVGLALALAGCGSTAPTAAPASAVSAAPTAQAVVPSSAPSGAPPTAAPAPAATPTQAPVLAGAWVAPKAGAKLTTSTLTLSAKPTATPSALSIAKVAFSVSWGSTTKVACSATKAGPGGVWTCTADLWKLGAPLSKLTLSFDVADSAGDVAKAPAGTRTVTLAAPPPAPKVTVTSGGLVGCSFAPTFVMCKWLTFSWPALPDKTARVQAVPVGTGEGGGTCAKSLAALPGWLADPSFVRNVAVASGAGATTMRWEDQPRTGGGAFCGWYVRSVNRYGASSIVLGRGVPAW